MHRNSKLTYTDIWAQWWSNANARGDHSHATNYWIGVYSGLAFLPLIALGTLSGYVLLIKAFVVKQKI